MIYHQVVGTLSQLLEGLDDDERRRGKEFEHICKWFLTNDPVYRRQLNHVWLWDDWPGRWGVDAGIDLVAEEIGGRLWAIQSKAYDPSYAITKTDVDSFLSESARAEFAFRLIIATTDRIGKTAKRTLQAQEKPAGCLLRGDLETAPVSWPQSPTDLRPFSLEPKRPRLHQQQAIDAVVRGFESADRGQLIMACGTGKTLTALFVAESLAAKRTLILVPSLALLTDTVNEWTANASKVFEFLPVCSDDTVVSDDAAVSTTTDFGFPVTTEPIDVAAFLREESRPLVVFATYQSSPRIAEAFRLQEIPAFDLVIADEAHRCSGPVSSDFATVLDSEAIPARRRLFMTATPRIFTKRVKTAAIEGDFELASMDDASHFGEVFHRLSFAEAIGRGLLSDYQVAIVGVDDATYLEWAERGRSITIDGAAIADAQTVAGQIGLIKAISRFDLRRVISFHSRVSWAQEFAKSVPKLIDWMPADQRPSGRLWCDSVHGQMPAGDRSRRLARLRHLMEGERGLLSNARCLGEGVDVPALDGVAFIDPRRSEVDIVQAVGRAIRLAEDKTIGTIVIPVFLGTNADPDEVLTGSSFRPVWEVLRALRAHDEQLGEQLDSLRRERGHRASSWSIPAKITLEIPDRIGTEFAAAFDVHLVDETTSSWEFGFGVLQCFVDREGHADVPPAHIEREFPLYGWMARQRAAFKSKELSPYRSECLQALPGWRWDPQEDQWQQGFNYLRSFLLREGHSRMPNGHMEGGYGLGKWVMTQRLWRRSGRLREDRRALLESLPGWVWEVQDDRWEDGYKCLLTFVEREGHAIVPAKCREGAYPLGAWVRRQRYTYLKGNLPSERTRRLESLSGWVWSIGRGRSRPSRYES